MLLKMYLLRYIDPRSGEVLRLPFFFPNDSSALRFCRATEFEIVRELDPNNFHLNESESLGTDPDEDGLDI